MITPHLHIIDGEGRFSTEERSIKDKGVVIFQMMEVQQK